jgi:hypothetical protein
LFRYDPIGINFEENTDEYEPEVGTILPRLEYASTEQEAIKIIHEEFIKWFDIDIAGSKEKYQALGTEVWTTWQKFKKNQEEDN